MPTAVVTGANSGVGNAFARLLIGQGYEVHALDRDDGPEISRLSCSTYSVDVSDERSVATFAKTFGNNKPLHLLLNVAGILPPEPTDKITTATKESFAKTFAVNSIGPFLLTQALVPNLAAAAQAALAGQDKASEPKVGIVSSRVGSMGDNTSGGGYAYRASKAAVNSIGKNLAIDLRDKSIAVLLLHPGIVRSNLVKDMSEEALKVSVDPAEAAQGLWRNVVSVKDLQHTGTFWHRDGHELPW